MSSKLIAGRCAFALTLLALVSGAADAAAQSIQITEENQSQFFSVKGLKQFDMTGACFVPSRNRGRLGIVRQGVFQKINTKGRKGRSPLFRRAVQNASKQCARIARLSPAAAARRNRIQPTATPAQRTPTPLPTISNSPIPELARWESNMRSYGATHCNTLKNTGLAFDPLLAATYYDAQWIYEQIAEYTGDSTWLSCATAAEKVYRDRYVVPNNGGVPGYWNFSHGLLKDFQRTGDASSKNAVVSLSRNAAFAPDTTPLSSTVHSDYSREVAYTIMAYLNAEAVGQPRRARLAQLVDQAHGHMDQWFVNGSAPYVRPFMVGITAQALIEYHAKTGDARVLPALARAADWLWARTWLPGSQAFMYTDRQHSTGGQEPAPDLNLLIAPMYSWLYHQTGEARFRDRGDAIFAGGVKFSYLTNAKQFNQSYRWSFEFLRWRKAQPKTVQPTSTPTAAPSSTPTLLPTSTKTPAPTSTPTPAATSTNTAVPTSTPTNTPTRTPTPVATSTNTPAPTSTPTRTPTPAATSTSTPAPTSTPTPAPTGTPSTVAIPNLAKWESQMRTVGLTHCNSLKGTASQSTKLNNTYYDAQWVYYQIADYTGDSSWISCAEAAETVYRDNYVLPSKGGVPGYWAFSHGMTQDYLRTGDTISKDAQLLMSLNAAYAVDATPLAWTVDDTYSREVAYHIMSYLNAEHLGQATRPKLAAFVEQAFGHMDQWFVSRSASYIRPFMVALTSQALIEWHDKTGDSRVVPTLTRAMDWIWDNMWLPSSRSFKYTNVETSTFPSSDPAYNTGGREPAPDLNLLIAPVYGWLYHQTGEVRFRDRGDQIFSGGVDLAFMGNGKQFNQNYRWSFAYVDWRRQAPLR